MPKTICKMISLRGLGIMIAIVVVIFDQLSKYLMTHLLHLSETINIFTGFSLVLRHNTGAAFSFLAAAGGWQRWFFVLLAVIISAVIVVWLGRLKSKDCLEALGLSLILGGALGNLWDRLVHGYVIDFILLYYKQWEYPAFNIADSAITVGVICFAIAFLRKS